MNKKSAFDEAKYQAEKGNKLEYDGVRSQYEVERPDGTSCNVGVRSTKLKADGTYVCKSTTSNHTLDATHKSKPWDDPLVVHAYNADNKPIVANTWLYRH